MVTTTFIDLFCGGGTATKGLVDSGLTHVVGYDYWQPAVNNMQANGWNSVVADISSTGPLPKANIVWASPPCTEYSSGSNHRAKRDEVKELVVTAVRLALTSDPAVIVLENHPGMLKAEQYASAIKLLDGWHIQEHILDAADIGSPSHRRRCFVIASRNTIPRMVWQQSKPVAWDTVVSIEGNGNWRTTNHAEYIERKLDGLPYCLYSYYSPPPVIDKPGTPMRTITCVPRSVIVHKDGTRRWLKYDNYRKLMGLPNSFVLTGTERNKCKIVGNGVAYACSVQIGKYLMNNME
jgi:cytosine-specific methyltransferase|nr:MAG TPA: Cytosine specific methyltransferase [Caudoviricetes sp.]